MQKITTFLTFKENGEEAVKFYVSLFENSKIISLARSQGEGRIAKGALIHASFQLNGQQFTAMDGGDYFFFGPGISLLINAETQEEIDRLWVKLSQGGEEQPYGWVKDKYGVSWQIIPSILGELLQHKDAEKAGRVMQAMFKMKKIVIKDLQEA